MGGIGGTIHLLVLRQGGFFPTHAMPSECIDESNFHQVQKSERGAIINYRQLRWPYGIRTVCLLPDFVVVSRDPTANSCRRYTGKTGRFGHRINPDTDHAVIRWTHFLSLSGCVILNHILNFNESRGLGTGRGLDRGGGAGGPLAGVWLRSSRDRRCRARPAWRAGRSNPPDGRR